MEFKDTNDFEGKKILITGASRGLGSLCAIYFSNLGAKLALLARSKSNLEKVRISCKNPKQHICIETDLMSKTHLELGVKDALEFLDGIDIVLHVAGGGLGLRDPLLSLEEIEQLFRLNVGAAVQINRLVIPEMIKNGTGNLVHVGSITSAEAVASVGYNTVKSALAAYVRSLGKSVAEDGIIATGILPGGFTAPNNSWERLIKNKPEVVKKFIDQRLPRGRLAEGEELLPMIHLLSSSMASMMSGCMVPIDAGEGISYIV